jgi:proteasome lid subunit RPN8/RPN11
VKISQTALAEAQAHAVEGYPYEICGMLVAEKGTRTVTGTRRATNADLDNSKTTYRIAPSEHREIEKECDAAGLDIVGYYHSHPDHASYASIRDTEQAWPDYYYLVVSCMNGDVGESKVFYRTDWDTKQMREESLEVIPG